MSATRERLGGLTAEAMLLALLDAPARDRAFLAALAADLLEEEGDARAGALRLAARRGWRPHQSYGCTSSPHAGQDTWDWWQNWPADQHGLPAKLFAGVTGGWLHGGGRLREYLSEAAALRALLDALASLPPDDFARLERSR